MKGTTMQSNRKFKEMKDGAGVVGLSASQPLSSLAAPSVNSTALIGGSSPIASDSLPRRGGAINSNSHKAQRFFILTCEGVGVDPFSGFYPPRFIARILGVSIHTVRAWTKKPLTAPVALTYTKTGRWLAPRMSLISHLSSYCNPQKLTNNLQNNNHNLRSQTLESQ